MFALNRRASIAFSAAVLLGVAACSDSTGAGTGTVSVRLTNESVAASVVGETLTSDAEAPLPAGSVKSIDIFVVRIDTKANEPSDDDAAENTEDAESSKGGWVTFMPIYWMPLENGSDTTLSLPLAFISWKSLNGSS